MTAHNLFHAILTTFVSFDNDTTPISEHISRLHTLINETLRFFDRCVHDVILFDCQGLRKHIKALEWDFLTIQDTEDGWYIESVDKKRARTMLAIYGNCLHHPDTVKMVDIILPESMQKAFVDAHPDIYFVVVKVQRSDPNEHLNIFSDN